MQAQLDNGIAEENTALDCRSIKSGRRSRMDHGALEITGGRRLGPPIEKDGGDGLMRVQDHISFFWPLYT